MEQIQKPLVPVRFELLPSGDRKTVCILVQSDQRIDMGFLLTCLEGWLKQTKEQFASIKIKNSLRIDE